MTRILSLAHLTAVELPPPAFIEAAAAAGFDAVGLRLLRVTPESPGYPLMDDPAAMRATRAALAATGLVVNDIEFIRLTPETRIEPLLPLLDAGAELSAGNVVCAPYDDDIPRFIDNLGQLAEAAFARGMRATLEFFPWTPPVPDLATCRRMVEAASPHAAILVDSLHFDRTGSSLADLAAVPAERLPFAHLCDAPVHPPYSTEDLLYAARAHRLPPGEGQIDLGAILSALPPDIPIGVEVPSPEPAEGAALVARLSHLRAATLRLLDRVAAG